MRASRESPRASLFLRGSRSAHSLIKKMGSVLFFLASGSRIIAWYMACSVLATIVLLGPVDAQIDSETPSLTTLNNSITMRAGGATLTLSGCGSGASPNGLPYSPIVTQNDLTARIDALQTTSLQAQVRKFTFNFIIYLFAIRFFSNHPIA